MNVIAPETLLETGNHSPYELKEIRIENSSMVSFFMA